MFNLILKKTIKFYQKAVAPFLRPACRFYPSCSEYSVQALEHYGSLKAVSLIAFRLLKCHPYHEGGHDPLKRPPGE